MMDTGDVRVLHVVSGHLFGGVENLLVTFAREREWVRGVHQEFALCFEEGRLRRELDALKAPVHVLGMPRMRHPWSVLQARKALGRILDGRSRPRFDVVVCHMLWAQIIFGPAVTKHGAALVFFCHEVLKPGRWLERLAARVRPDHAVGSSRFVASVLPRLYPGLEGGVVYPPVNLKAPHATAEERARIRAELATPDDAVVIAQVGRMTRYKGHTLHIDALGQLRDVPRWHCWMIGGPQNGSEQPYYDELRGRAEHLGIGDRVHFLGERRDVPRLLSAVDIHCQPNISPEPFGLTFIEAMAAGLPVVSTSMGGALEILDADSGVLVPPTTSALARALHDLIGDPERRRAFAPAASARARTLCDPEVRLADFSTMVTAAASRT